MENNTDQRMVELLCFGIGFLTVAFITFIFIYAGRVGLFLAPLSAFLSVLMGYYLCKDILELFKTKGQVK